MSSLFQPIYTQTVGAGGVASITFNNIPQNFTDLKILISARSTNANTYDNFNVRFNGSSAGYNQRLLYGTGTAVQNQGTVFTDRGFVCDITASTTFASTFANVELYISGYNNGNQKTYTVTSAHENNITAAFLEMTAGTWNSRQPITSLSLFSNGGNLVQHTTATLYGILKPGNRPKASGGNIYFDGQYWYHAFRDTGSSAFIANENISGEALVIGGGGGGGGGGSATTNGRGGGGGAGGVVTVPVSFSSGSSYSMVVGAGGLAGAKPGAGGSDTYFGGAGGVSYILGPNTNIIYARGGGGGGSGNNSGTLTASNNGRSGSSGGGAATYVGAGTAGAADWYDQGFAGGGGTEAAPSYGAGGGGGMGGLGVSGTSTAGGAGGVGTFAFSRWGLTTGTGQNVSGTFYYAGGGGGAVWSTGSGGAGGFGGGGAGVYNTTGNSGTANTGGGGGGSTDGSIGGAGGSGLIIIRYQA
jgi:hypothetical protein